MTEYIVKSDDSEWYVYLSQIDGMSLIGCAEIAHKFQTIGGDIQSTALKCEKCDKKMVMYHGITGKPTYNYIIKNGLRLR